MKPDPQGARSVWTEDAQPASRPKLSERIDAEVVVVGAGLTGLSIAYELQKAGRSVAVLERGRVGEGETSRTSGHLSFECDDFYHVLARQRGGDAARVYHQSQSAGVDRIEAIAREEGIACDFARVDGFLISAGVDDDDLLDLELEAARAAGVPGVAFADQAPLKGVDTGAALRFPNQARFHPLKYALGLAEAFERAGGLIFGDTEVVELGAAGGRAAVRTADGLELSPAQAVAATRHAFGPPPSFHAKQAPFRSYLIAAEIEPGAAADILLWDSARRDTYARLQPGRGRDLLIVGGQDQRMGTADDAEARLESLEGWTRLRFPEMGEVTHRWSERVFEPNDNSPFIGRMPGEEGVFMVTGDSGEGAAVAAAAGLILRELMTGRESPWAALYDPSRATPVAQVAEFVMERASVVAALVERLTPGEVKSVDDIAPGMGAVVQAGASRVAAYRQDDGTLLRRSAACTHAPCNVRFNSLDRCWDCACHGCAYAVDGSVLAGPATEPLAVV